ncbi:MAG: MATE family efflux transporter [Myxococcota bacterium]
MAYEKSVGSKQAGTHRDPRVLPLAVPIMLSNVSTPLVGVIDTSVVGQLEDPSGIGAVSLGSMVFTVVFLAFGFLRMGTTGLTAQAVGAADRDEEALTLCRGLVVAFAAGVMILVFSPLLRELAFLTLEGSAEVERGARTYFNIRVISAPFALTNYVIVGWFVGRGRTDVALSVQLLLGGVNLVLDALLVLAFELGIEGIAWGTLSAEVVAMATGLCLALRHRVFRVGLYGQGALGRRLFDRSKVRRLLSVNVDIMVRSVALTSVFLWFTAKGAAFGDVTLAANTILAHSISVSAYFLDGLAFATETLVGQAFGKRDVRALVQSVRRASIWALLFASALSLSIFWLGPLGIDALTVDEETRLTAKTYLPWASLGPIFGVAAYQLDGVFIGATRTGHMRNAMLLSLALFACAYVLLRPYGNHGLWIALLLHYPARAVTLLWGVPELLRAAQE